MEPGSWTLNRMCVGGHQFALQQLSGGHRPSRWEDLFPDSPDSPQGLATVRIPDCTALDRCSLCGPRQGKKLPKGYSLLWEELNAGFYFNVREKVF